MSPSSTRRGRGSSDSQSLARRDVPAAFRGDMQDWFRGPGGAAPGPGPAGRDESSAGRGRRGGASGRHRRAAGEVSAPLPEPTSLWGFTGRYGSGPSPDSTPDGHAEARSTLAAGGWTPAAGSNGSRSGPAVSPAESTRGRRASSNAAAHSGPIETTGSWRVRAAGDAVAEQRDRDWDAAVTGQQASVESTGSWRPRAGGTDPRDWRSATGQQVAPTESTGSWRPRSVPDGAPGREVVRRSPTGWNGAPAVESTGGWSPGSDAGSGRRRAPEVGYGAGSAVESRNAGSGRRRAPEAAYGAGAVVEEAGSWRPTVVGSDPPDWLPATGQQLRVVEPAGPWPDRSAGNADRRRDQHRDVAATGWQPAEDSTGSWPARPEVDGRGRPANGHQPALESGSWRPAPVGERDWGSANGHHAGPAETGSWQAGPEVDERGWQPANGHRAGLVETGSWRAGPEVDERGWQPANGHRAGLAETGSWRAAPEVDERGWQPANGHRAGPSATGSWRAVPADQRDGPSATGRHSALTESTGSWRGRSPSAAAAARQLAAGRERATHQQSVLAAPLAAPQRPALPAAPRRPAPDQPAPDQPAPDWQAPDWQARQRPARERQASQRLALPAAPQPAPARDWRQDTTGTGEWPTTEWTRAGRAPAEWRTAVVRRAAAPVTSPAEPAAAVLPRLLGSVHPDGRPVPLDDHLQAYGRLPELAEERASDMMLRLVGQSGLRGRGGAGFPVEKKMRAVLAAKGKAVVVVNGAAGDPTSEKDAFLLSRVPHLILDGAQAAAQAVGARQVLVYVVARPRVYGVVERAVAERRRAEIDAVPVRLVAAPDTYVAGESSAVAQHLSGGPALPMFHPPHTAERGVKGRPTLVQNVETLANLALLVRYGARWFRAVGTPDEPGSLVLTVRGAVPRPVVIEVPVGTTIEQALAGAGGMTEPVGAVLVGGCMGRWLPAASALSASLSHAGMDSIGGVLGANVVFALPDRACGLHETARLVRYLAAESAGQCGSCLNGLPAIATALSELADSRADQATVQRLYRWCGMVAGRGACNHPDGVVALVASALQVFADEGGRHLGGWCSRPLRTVLPLPATADRPAGLAPNRPVRAPGRPTQEPLGWDEERYGPWSTGPQQLQLTSGRRGDR